MNEDVLVRMVIDYVILQYLRLDLRRFDFYDVAPLIKSAAFAVIRSNTDVKDKSDVMCLHIYHITIEFLFPNDEILLLIRKRREVLLTKMLENG